jgi:guanosine-3',5'-bis(diphosphate) 3'-pyrophosphohydrolase
VQHASDKAKIVKLCDKLYNLRDLIRQPPGGYTVERIQGYCVWSRMVLKGATGLNAPLEKCLNDEIWNNTFTFEGKIYPCCPESIGEEWIFPKQ